MFLYPTVRDPGPEFREEERGIKEESQRRLKMEKNEEWTTPVNLPNLRNEIEYTQGLQFVSDLVNDGGAALWQCVCIDSSIHYLIISIIYSSYKQQVALPIYFKKR